MKNANTFFDGIVSLETTVKLCDEFLDALDNLHHKVPKELEPRLCDFTPRRHRYRTESYKYSLYGGVIGVVCAIILIFLGEKFKFDAMLPALIIVLLGASSGLVIMGLRRYKENAMEKRAMIKYKSALDDYYAKHRTESFVASMKSANIVTFCCEKIREIKAQSADILGKMYTLGNIPEEARNLQTMCAALVCASEMPRSKDTKKILNAMNESHFEKSQYGYVCTESEKMVTEICKDIKTDEAYDDLKKNITRITDGCHQSNEEIKAKFSIN